MFDSLIDRLNSARRRTRLVLLLHGASWIVAVVFGAALLVGLLDWRWHLDDPGVRFLLGLSILAAGGWVAWKFLIVPLRRPLTELDIALRIEERYPEAEGLASTVQFVGAGFDERLGSRALQQRVARTAARRIGPLDFFEIVDTRPVRKIALGAIGVCLLATLLVALDQSAAATALRRLVAPFSAGPWPRTTELVLLDDRLRPLDHAGPTRVVSGGILEVRVENRRGRLPHEVAIEYAIGDARADAIGDAPDGHASDGSRHDAHREILLRTTRRDTFQNEREVAAGALTFLRGPVRIRAVGGDDATAWHEVEVVPPPALEEFRVTLHPPAYARRPSAELSPGTGRVEALVGTEVAIAARANKPLSRALLRLRDTQSHPVWISDDGLTLAATFGITEAGSYSYWFDLEDRHGFANPEAARHEVRGLADLIPDVSIPRPATELRVTATAVVPMRIVAKDDIGLREVRLRFNVRDSEDGAAPPVVLHAGEERPDRLEISYEFDLAPLRLSPGMRVFYHAEATDDYDLGSQHVGRSLTGTLTVVSPDEKRSELAGRQSTLQEELDRAFDTQSRVRRQLGELLLQLDKAGELPPADLDLLKRIEIEQKNISARLLNPVDGVRTAAQALLDEQAANDIDDAETRDRLGRIVGELGRLSREPLPAIERHLTRARKLVRLDAAGEASAPPPAAQQAAALDDAGRGQDDVLDALDDLRSLLAKWRNRRELERDLDGLIAGQQRLHDDSAELGRATFGRKPDELSPQQQADLARVSDRQSRQADDFDRFAERLRESGERMAETDRVAADALLDAADRARRAALAGRMREAAAQLQRNEVGAATARQQELLAELNELKQSLDPPAATDAETLVKRLAEKESELGELLRKQRDIQHRLERALADPDPASRAESLARLAKELRELREQTLEAAGRLRRLAARRAADAARRAASNMRSAERSLAGDDPAAARANLDEALEDLDQSLRETASARRSAEERLAREMMERIADDLAGMIARQQNVIDETHRLDEARTAGGAWSRAQLKSLRDLADVQDGLRIETLRLAESVRAAEVFALVLEGAAGRMSAAVGRLRARLVDETTVAHEEAARRRFEELVATLRPDSPRKSDPGNEPDAPEQPNGPDQDGIPQIAELKLLKLLQQDLLERTAALDANRAADDLSPEQRTELDELAAAQDRLADLARNLTARLARSIEERGADESNGTEPRGAQDARPDGPETEAGESRGGIGVPSHAQPTTSIWRRYDGGLTSIWTSYDEAAPPEDAPSLDATIGRMRTVRERLALRDSGGETRALQQRIIEDLDRLIEQTESRRPGGSASRIPIPVPQSEQSQPSEPTPSLAGSDPAGSPGQRSPTADESKPGVREDREAAPVDRRILDKDVWGHLAPDVRGRMLSDYTEKYLPKYDEVVRKYFEALAEQSREEP
ncbi:MAG: hypothetical protein WD066_18505 [Planctomycetaceae bacterium]